MDGVAGVDAEAEASEVLGEALLGCADGATGIGPPHVIPGQPLSAIAINASPAVFHLNIFHPLGIDPMLVYPDDIDEGPWEKVH